MLLKLPPIILKIIPWMMPEIDIITWILLRCNYKKHKTIPIGQDTLIDLPYKVWVTVLLG